MSDNKTWSREQTTRVRDFYNVYTRGFSGEEFQRLFTRDTRDAYRYFSRGIDREELGRLPWWKRPTVFARGFFLAVTMKMSPARRVLFAVALMAGLLGLFALSDGLRTVWIPIDPIVLRVPLLAPVWPSGTGWLVLSMGSLVLLVLLEVFERLSLKNDLEIARDIQQAMLPSGLYANAGLEAFGITRPANTVGGDFYDILPLPDGRVVVALGDVAGKGSPAALLMALLLAMQRTLLDLGLDAAPLLERLNIQILRHAPSTRFITLLFVTVDPVTGDLVSVNAGHLPGLIRRRDGHIDYLLDGGIALGMFEASTYKTQTTRLEPGDEGLIALIHAHAAEPDLRVIGKSIIKAVEHHAQDVRFADDLTILMARRPAEPGPVVEPPPLGDAGLGIGNSGPGIGDSGLGIGESGPGSRGSATPVPADSAMEPPPIPGSPGQDGSYSDGKAS